MNQKIYWDKVAPVKEFTTPFQMEVFQNYVSKNASILDIGCGYGRTLNELYNNGYKNSIGIDFSGKMIERGKNTFPHLTFEITEKGKTKYSENTFDAVILLAVLTCILSNEEQMELLNEIRRILKPEGVIYINDFLLNNDERNVERYEEYKSAYEIYGIFELPEGAIVRHHDAGWVKESLKIFQELEYREVNYVTMNGNNSNGYYYLGKK